MQVEAAQSRSSRAKTQLNYVMFAIETNKNNCQSKLVIRSYKHRSYKILSRKSKFESWRLKYQKQTLRDFRNQTIKQKNRDLSMNQQEQKWRQYLWLALN